MAWVLQFDGNQFPKKSQADWPLWPWPAGLMVKKSANWLMGDFPSGLFPMATNVTPT